MSENFNSFINKAHNSDWTDDVSNLLRTKENESFDDKDLKLISNQFYDYARKEKFGHAYNWAILKLGLSNFVIPDNDHFFDCFLPFKYNDYCFLKFKSFLKRVYTFVHDNRPGSPLEIKIESLSNYADIYTEIIKYKKILLKILTANPGDHFQHLLKIAEDAFSQKSFMEDYHAVEPNQIHKKLGISREHLATVVSFLFSLGRSFLSTPQSRSRSILKASGWDSEEIVRIIMAGNKILDLSELGSKIARMGYICEKTDNRHFKIKPPSIEFDVSLSYGYLRSKLREGTYFDQIDTSKPTILNFAEDAARSLKENIFELIGKGDTKSLRLLLPEPFFNKVAEILKSGYFQDEQILLFSLCYDLYANPDDLIKSKLTENLTVMDIFNIIRILQFVAYLREQKLAELRETDLQSYINSLVLGIKDQPKLIEFLTIFGIEDIKAKDFLTCITWNPKDRDDYFDIHYSPIINFGDCYTLPLNIMAHSNFIRNVLMKTHNRLTFISDNNPDEFILENTLKKLTANVARGIEYSSDGKKGEIDILMIYEDDLYIFECKNSLLPCNSHEIMTLCDYLNKAASQLDQTLQLIKTKQFRNYLFSKLNWPLNSFNGVKTGIILGTRLFSGYCFNGHPVRHLRELQNYIEHGTINIGINALREEIKLWEGEKLTKREFDAYLSERNILFSRVLDSIQIIERPLEVGEIEITSSVYLIDPMKYYKKIGAGEPILKELEKNIKAGILMQ